MGLRLKKEIITDKEKLKYGVCALHGTLSFLFNIHTANKHDPMISPFDNYVEISKELGEMIKGFELVDWDLKKFFQNMSHVRIDLTTGELLDLTTKRNGPEPLPENWEATVEQVYDKFVEHYRNDHRMVKQVIKEVMER